MRITEQVILKIQYHPMTYGNVKGHFQENYFRANVKKTTLIN